MPNKPSAKKALRQADKRASRNKAVKEKVKTLLKKSKKAISEKNLESAQTILKETSKALAQAAQKGIIKKKSASRKTSRLVKLYNKTKNS